jgi:hypothetical protein
MTGTVEERIKSLEYNLFFVAKYSLEEIEEAKSKAEDILGIVDNLEALWNKYAKVWDEYAEKYNRIKEEDRVYQDIYEVKIEAVENPRGEKGFIVHAFKDGKGVMRDYWEENQSVDGVIELVRCAEVVKNFVK